MSNAVLEVAGATMPRIERHEVVPVTPMSMLQMAVQQGADLDKMQKLMDLQERWEANEARKAFVTAMNGFKANPPVLHKNKKVSFNETKYMHATLDQVSGVIGQALSAHGLSHRWEVAQLDAGMIRVTCIITHALGHSEQVSLQCGADQSGKKNNIQAVGSTVTYLERYTLLAAAGIAVKDQDDDAKRAEGPEPDEEGKAALEACGSMPALEAAWKLLTKGQRVTLGEVKNDCKNRIQEADAG